MRSCAARLICLSKQLLSSVPESWLLWTTGLVAERCFGFRGSLAETAEASSAAAMRNAEALASSLLACLIVPWFLCLLFYTGAPPNASLEEALLRLFSDGLQHGWSSLFAPM